MSENKTLTAILAIISIFLLGAVAFGLTQIDSLNTSSKNTTNTLNTAKQSTAFPNNAKIDINNEIKLAQDSDESRINAELDKENAKMSQQSNKDPKKEISATNEIGVPENKPKSLLEVADANSEISIFLSAIKAAGIEEEVKVGGPLTIFAPDNESFTKHLLPETLAELQKPEKKVELARTLRFHIVNGLELNKDLINEKQLATLESGILTISVIENGKKGVDGIEVVKSDLVASNGVIHVINRLIQE